MAGQRSTEKTEERWGKKKGGGGRQPRGLAHSRRETAGRREFSGKKNLAHSRRRENRRRELSRQERKKSENKRESRAKRGENEKETAGERFFCLCIHTLFFLITAGGRPAVSFFREIIICFFEVFPQPRGRSKDDRTWDRNKWERGGGGPLEFSNFFNFFWIFPGFFHFFVCFRFFTFFGFFKFCVFFFMVPVAGGGRQPADRIEGRLYSFFWAKGLQDGRLSLFSFLCAEDVMMIKGGEKLAIGYKLSKLFKSGAGTHKIRAGMKDKKQWC